jgi:hypothetical protein
MCATPNVAALDEACPPEAALNSKIFVMAVTK